MTDLTAIDILVNPDDAAIAKAHAFNARMRQSVPSGFALDATHQPHITTLQRYVRTANLDRVYEAVENTINATAVGTLGYEAVAIGHADWGVRPGPCGAGDQAERRGARASRRTSSGRSPRTSGPTAPRTRSSGTRAS